MKRLAVITSHPIQYIAPLFKLLAQSKKIEIKVFYTWGQAQAAVYDPGFGRERQWDIPLLEGYEYEFLENVSTEPGSHHFKGIINPGIIKSIENYNPNALLIYGWGFKSHLNLMRHFHNKKTILFRGDSNLLDEKPGFSFKKIIRKYFLTWVYHYVDYALYTGEANRRYFKKFGLKDDQLIFAPHAINNNAFNDNGGSFGAASRNWRKGLGITEGEIVFLFAGKFESKKDPLLLANTFMQLPYKTIRLVFTGNGIMEQELKEVTKEDKRIIFLPFQNQSKMPVLYRVADIFVLPSKGPGETWGLAVNEAMACGKAVLVSNACGCYQDLVKHKHNGYIFESANKDSLRDGFNYFINNAEQLCRMGLNSKEIIRDWSYTKIEEAISRLLLSIKPGV
jgi:glycosyltransferase involved in cell wall biosynthesis